MWLHSVEWLYVKLNPSSTCSPIQGPFRSEPSVNGGLGAWGLMTNLLDASLLIWQQLTVDDGMTTDWLQVRSQFGSGWFANIFGPRSAVLPWNILTKIVSQLLARAATCLKTMAAPPHRVSLLSDEEGVRMCRKLMSLYMEGLPADDQFKQRPDWFSHLLCVHAINQFAYTSTAWTITLFYLENKTLGRTTVSVSHACHFFLAERLD